MGHIYASYLDLVFWMFNNEFVRKICFFLVFVSLPLMAFLLLPRWFGSVNAACPCLEGNGGNECSVAAGCGCGNGTSCVNGCCVAPNPPPPPQVNCPYGRCGIYCCPAPSGGGGAACGSGGCQVGETCSSCPRDCGSCVGSPPQCTSSAQCACNGNCQNGVCTTGCGGAGLWKQYLWVHRSGGEIASNNASCSNFWGDFGFSVTGLTCLGIALGRPLWQLYHANKALVAECDVMLFRLLGEHIG